MKAGDLVYWHDEFGIRDFGIVTNRRPKDEYIDSNDHWWIFWFDYGNELSLPDDVTNDADQYAFNEADFLRFAKSAWFEIIKLHGDSK